MLVIQLVAFWTAQPQLVGRGNGMESIDLKHNKLIPRLFPFNGAMDKKLI